MEMSDTICRNGNSVKRLLPFGICVLIAGYIEYLLIFGIMPKIWFLLGLRENFDEGMNFLFHLINGILAPSLSV